MTFDIHFSSLGLVVWASLRLAGLPNELAVPIGGMVGAPQMLPDLIAAPETLRGNWDGLYQKTHSYEWWRVHTPKWFADFMSLHIWIDSWSHKSTGGYNWMGYAASGLTWGILLWLLFGRCFG